MEQLTASAQYGDITGQLALDENHNMGLQQLARDNGIDTDVDFPVAFDIYAENNTPRVSILTVQREKSDYDTVKDYIDANDPFEVKEFTFDISYEDFFKHFKRVSFVGVSMEDIIGKNYIVVD